MKINALEWGPARGLGKYKLKNEKMNSPIKLTNDDGCLSLNGGVLIYWHKGGDVDTIDYPRPNKTHLRAALYNAREMGWLPSNVDSVILPSGRVFSFDVA